MNEVENLIRALYQTVGNKRYMYSIEKLLRENLAEQLTPPEREALRYLSQDLKNVKMDADRKPKLF
jgi:hypothetical protein